jgi:hypothetical protein
LKRDPLWAINIVLAVLTTGMVGYAGGWFESKAEHLANLPRDPGAKGKKTIEGIDADKDGVRDDVQRFIALNWGHSERVVRALSGVAKGVQMEVLIGDSVSRDEAKRLAEKFVMNSVTCFSRSVDEGIVVSSALENVVNKVANTPARSRRKHSFEYLAAHQVYMLSDASITELCGYDPATLPN